MKHDEIASAFSSPGVAVLPDGIQFTVWAPDAKEVHLVIEEDTASSRSMQKQANGCHFVRIEECKPGALYRYLLDGKGPYPDPCSRFQPMGPHGPSAVVDPVAWKWQDHGWPGIEMKSQVIYELHIGAFTPEGTFDAAITQLSELRKLGITVIEVMPIAEFPGRWNWGYDGVNLYAPYHGYGDYEAFKRFVDAAHRQGLAVILDVVYNHLGPDGNYLSCYSKDYFTDRYKNEWSKAINFDGPDSGMVREYFIRNACYWITEFHLDGLRLDATQSIFDSSRVHVLAELSQRARAAAHPRNIILIAENEPQKVELISPVEHGGYGMDAMWNDDFHHSARVALTGRHDGYFHDHRGKAQEFISAAKRGFLFQGQYYHWQKQPRGTPVTTQPAWAMVTFIQNHDQVGNTFYGQRLSCQTSPGRNRAMTAFLLLAPQTPMLFMGQEFAASQPFPFFADHHPELNAKVHAGRKEFLAQFHSYATPDAQHHIHDPASEATFLSAKLDMSERETHLPVYALHQDLLALRRTDPVISAQDRDAIDGAVLAERAWALRWFDAQHGDRLLLVNLGDELDLHPAPEPLLAPPPGRRWRLAWSSDAACYDGSGSAEPCTETGWSLSAESAVFLIADPLASQQFTTEQSR